ncbi:MAG TPA: DUF5658 family protein [Steroidobacteraceae bacterium]|nr:DUF5658 family protein [Steroidobacteraceae bacterium]
MPAPEDWTPARAASTERRLRPDRRRRVWWALLYGSVRPRRRQLARRAGDARFQAMDWHGTHLWAASIAILIMSVADAFLTLLLMSGGAVEVNPFMAAFVGRSVGVFVVLKIAMTGISVVLMVFLARYRFMRVVRVEVLLYGVVLAYVLLIVHEMRMLRVLGERVFL